MSKLRHFFIIICSIISFFSGMIGSIYLIEILRVIKNYNYEKESDLYIEPIYNWYIHGQSIFTKKMIMILCYIIFIIFILLIILIYKKYYKKKKNKNL